MSNTRVDQTGNGFCGPLVLAAIMGCSTAEAAERVRQATLQKRAIKGTDWWELEMTLRQRGFRTSHKQVPAQRYVADRVPGKPLLNGAKWDAQYTPVKLVGPTLAEWLRTTKRDPDAYYIIEVPHHWVLVKGRKFVDTFTEGEWVFLRSAPHRRKRVKAVWKVERI